MVDFQYRVAMDTYEQFNGRLKAPPVVYEPVDAPAKPGLLRRLLQVVRGARSERRPDAAGVQPGAALSSGAGVSCAARVALWLRSSGRRGAAARAEDGASESLASITFDRMERCVIGVVPNL
jgi:hypothetical protein